MMAKIWVNYYIYIYLLNKMMELYLIYMILIETIMPG